jgi:hypothetical protein
MLAKDIATVRTHPNGLVGYRCSPLYKEQHGQFLSDIGTNLYTTEDIRDTEERHDGSLHHVFSGGNLSKVASAQL